ncbi:hypothetical protein ACOMHN_019587 [Nucella lapillus]
MGRKYVVNQTVTFSVYTLTGSLSSKAVVYIAFDLFEVPNLQWFKLKHTYYNDFDQNSNDCFQLTFMITEQYVGRLDHIFMKRLEVQDADRNWTVASVTVVILGASTTCQLSAHRPVNEYPVVFFCKTKTSLSFSLSLS